MGRMMNPIAASVAALLMLNSAVAAEITAFRREQRIGAHVRNLDLPASLRKDLVSGLTNRLLIRVTLRHGSQPVQDTTVEVAVRYDLWEEIFHLTIATPQGTTASSERSLAAILARLANLQLPGLFDPSSVAPNATHVLQADVLLNPIDRERMKKIRQWIAENTTAAPGDPGAATHRRTAASELFAKIFEQYASGSEAAAIWTRTIQSLPFRLSDLSDETP